MLFLVAAVSFTIGYGAVAKAFPTPYWRGYFYNAYDSSGLEVLPPWGGPSGCSGDGWALPGWVDTPNEFTNFIVCKLGGNSQNHIGAAFIISTMSGMRNSNPGAAEINEFRARVNYASSQGWINFNASVGCILPNTYYQDGPRDVAAYGGCATGPGTAIVMYNGNGGYYVIKRFCANPLGNMSPLHDDQNFNMSGRTTVTNQTNAARGANPFPGDRLIFHHYVRNNGPTVTSPTNIWAIAERMEPAPQAVVAGAGNFGPFGIGEVNVYNTTVDVPAGTVPGTRYCQRVGYDPVNAVGGRNGRGGTVCATVAYNYSLNPSINIQINGINGPVTGTNIAEPGDTINFTYAVNNTGTTVSQTVTCTYRQATYTGYNQTQPVTAFTPGGANCAPTRTFPYGANTTVATELGVPANTPNTSICRSLTITPTTATGGTRTTTPPACVFVAAKPYTRVYGGDVSAGGGLVISPSSPTSCVQSAGAAVIGWNRRAGGAYAGAGVQFAAYAMSTIFDTASALGNGGGAATPIGLSFRNTSTNVTNGNFGGSLGTTTCIPDYYSRRPASPLVPPTGPNAITNMVTGIYGSTAREYYSGTADISPGERIVVYVNGDAYINANIRYTGTWTSANIPSFQLIARGNIYIDRNITQLDGLYVAQASGGSGGIIYTCADTATLYVPLPLVGQLGSRCNTKLTVNGGFVARQVQLIRTRGTLRQSAAGETSAGGNMSEVFNYNPSLWIPQPAAPPGAADYDAINSLPPIL